MGKNKKSRNKQKADSATALSPIKHATAAYPLIPRNILVGSILLLVFLAVILYANSYGHDYAYDDLAVLKENRFVKKGTDGIGDILRTQYFEGYDPNTKGEIPSKT